MVRDYMPSYLVSVLSKRAKSVRSWIDRRINPPIPFGISCGCKAVVPCVCVVRSWIDRRINPGLTVVSILPFRAGSHISCAVGAGVTVLSLPLDHRQKPVAGAPFWGGWHILFHPLELLEESVPTELLQFSICCAP